jgi:hypothetical protein
VVRQSLTRFLIFKLEEENTTLLLLLPKQKAKDGILASATGGRCRLVETTYISLLDKKQPFPDSAHLIGGLGVSKFSFVEDAVEPSCFTNNQQAWQKLLFLCLRFCEVAG